ncbi:sugar phosphate isomerase/epimerase family protein [Actinomyces wuliandei]|uniref:sugar phosphate isomerase/epimerase family protein n=1 Tax=Actinomyces wuliandei TaxID=2057743 RepID=UPI001FAA046B|nr:TIM barrel protein [Actinomyces wuliandei]
MIVKESLHDYMKVGIVHFMAYPFAAGGDQPVAASVAEVVEDDFFEEIEITRINDREERDAVTGLLRTSGVDVGFGAQPWLLKGGYDLNSFDEDRRAQAVAAMKAAVDQAYEVGARKIGFLSGPRPPQRRDEALALLVDSVVQVGRYARSQGDGGLVLSLETFDDSTDKRALVGTNRLACEVASEVRKAVPDFGLMVDLSHLPMQGETPRQALSATRDFINHAHIGTCVIRDLDDPAYGDLHPYFSHPKGESGVPEVREFLRCLLDIGYLREDAAERAVVAFEVQPLGAQRSRAVVADAKRVLREAWRTL